MCLSKQQEEAYKKKEEEQQYCKNCPEWLQGGKDMLMTNKNIHGYNLLAKVLKHPHKHKKDNGEKEKALELIINSVSETLNPGLYNFSYILFIKEPSGHFPM